MGVYAQVHPRKVVCKIAADITSLGKSRSNGSTLFLSIFKKKCLLIVASLKKHNLLLTPNGVYFEHFLLKMHGTFKFVHHVFYAFMLFPP